MNTIQVVLVDDEAHCTETLAMQLAALDLQVEVQASFNEAESALRYLKTASFDLLFLDIEMPGMNGFVLLNQAGDIRFDVVFTTAYNQYAVRAFQYSALHYLLKPIDDDDLRGCFASWGKKQEKQLNQLQFRLFKDLLQQKQGAATKIALPVTDGFELIETSRIIRCQADNYYCHFIMEGGKDLLVCRTMKEVEQLLKSFGFIRIHQSHLVNSNHIKKFSRQDGGIIVTTDQVSLRISKGYKGAVMQMLDQVNRL